MMNTTLDDLSAEIGFTATMVLTAWFGDGTGNLYVPAKIMEGQLLVKLVGLPAATRLSAVWGGEWLAVPSLAGYEDQMRRRFIGRLLERGFGSREIAFRMQMSERRIQQICRELEAQGLMPIIVPKKRVARVSAGKPDHNPLEKAGPNFGGKIPKKTTPKKSVSATQHPARRGTISERAVAGDKAAVAMKHFSNGTVKPSGSNGTTTTKAPMPVGAHSLALGAAGASIPHDDDYFGKHNEV